MRIEVKCKTDVPQITRGNQSSNPFEEDIIPILYYPFGKEISKAF